MNSRTEYHRAWSRKNPDRIKGYYRKHLEKYPTSGMHKACKGRAKKLGIPFDISMEDLIIPTHCPVLGIELKQKSRGKSGPAFNSPSIDRINPSIGYTKDNIQIISFKANAMKQDATLEELRKFSAWVNQLEL